MKAAVISTSAFFTVALAVGAVYSKQQHAEMKDIFVSKYGKK